MATANFFHTEELPTSAHYVIDPKNIVQCLPENVVAYHCGHNQDSIGIELCIYPLLGSMTNWLKPKSKRKKLKQHQAVAPITWLRPRVRRMLRLAAKLTAEGMHKRGVEPTFRGVAQLKTWERNHHDKKYGGVTTHNNMSQAFHESTHWDPGAWPQNAYMKMLRQEYAALQKSKKAPAKGKGK